MPLLFLGAGYLQYIFFSRVDDEIWRVTERKRNKRLGFPALFHVCQLIFIKVTKPSLPADVSPGRHCTSTQEV